jgi:hypothetical protein
LLLNDEFDGWIGVWCGDAGLFAGGIDHAATRTDVNSVFFPEHGLVVEQFHVFLDAGQTSDVRRQTLEEKKPNQNLAGLLAITNRWAKPSSTQ